MDILNNSIVDTVIEYANVNFGVELEKDVLASNLKELSYSQTLALVDAIKDEDNDKFTDYIDLSAVNEGWSRLPDIDREKYQERDGLEGPIQTKAGKVIYYDPKEGKYYDPDTDIYLSYEEFKDLDEGFLDTAKNAVKTVGNAVKNIITPGAVKVARKTNSIGKQGSIAKQIGMKGFGEDKKEKFKPHMMYHPKTGKGIMAKREQDHLDLKDKGYTHDRPKKEKIEELITPTVATGSMSAATMRKANNNTPQRRANIANQDAQRDSTGTSRTVAGGNKSATGQGAARYDKRQDPDDVQRGQNAQAAGQAQNMAANNSTEIARLRDLIQGRG